MAVNAREIINNNTQPGAAELSTAVDPNVDTPTSDYYAYEQDVNRLARGVTAGTVVEVRDTARRQNIRVGLSASTWSEPESPYGASYPHNQVMQTPNGLIQEFDDTPGNVRYHRYHPSGTYTEVDNNGTEVRKIVGDNYYIVEKNGNIFIGGRASVTIENTCNILILGDASIEVNGKMTALVKNDVSIISSGSMNLNVGETLNIKADNIVMESNKFNQTTVGDQKIKARKISTEVSQSYDMKIGTTFRLQSASYDLTTSGDTNIKTNNSNISAAGQINHKSAGTASFDGSDVRLGGSTLHMNAGTVKAATSAKETLGSNIYPVSSPGPAGPNAPAEATAPSVSAPDNTNLTQTPARAASADSDSPPTARPNSRTQRAAIENDGGTRPVGRSLYPGYGSPPPYISPADTVAVPNNITPVSGVEVEARFANITHPPYEELISKYVRLKDITINARFGGHQIPAGGWNGLTLGQIVTNLQVLAVNVIDPIIEKYGRSSVILLSGFRRQTSRDSQHMYGEAIDLRFDGLPEGEYAARAAQLLQEVPFDQFILEYHKYEPGLYSGLPWFHISYKRNGNRREYFTMSNGDRSSPISVL